MKMLGKRAGLYRPVVHRHIIGNFGDEEFETAGPSN